MSRFRNLDRLGNRISVSIPTDSEGFLGRECPEKDCEGYFKIKPGTGLTGPDLKCHCPYCGHTGDPDTFFTKEQIEYAESMVHRKVIDALNRDFKSLEFNHPAQGSFGIGISMKFTPASLPPVRYYRDPNLETQVTCDSCTLEYSIYGVFGYCPDCRVHNSYQILERNLDLVRKQIALAETLQDPDLTRHLLEDALENCVSSFDGFGRETCLVRAAASTDPKGCTSISFQNLDRVEMRLTKLFAFDLKAGTTSHEWFAARRCFLKRHVIAHRAGVADEQYVDESLDASAIVGRRLQIARVEIEETIAVLQKIANHIVRGLPAPP